MIDHVLVKARWRSAVLRMSPVYSDHRVVLCQYRPRLHVKTEPSTGSVDFTVLRSDKELRDQIASELVAASNYQDLSKKTRDCTAKLPRRRELQLPPVWEEVREELMVTDGKTKKQRAYNRVTAEQLNRIAKFFVGRKNT